MVDDYAPDRGDVIWIMLDPSLNGQQSRRNSAVVVSPGSYNKLVGLALICPITTDVKGYPFEVLLPDAIPITGAVLADHVGSIDWRAAQAVFAARLPDTTIEEILQKTQALLR